MSTFEKQFDQCCAEIAKRMQISEVTAGFQILEAPAGDGAPLKVWPPTFQTKRAAELFLEELIAFYVICDPEEFYGASTDAKYCVEHFEEIATVWGSLEAQGIANPRKLACTFCARWPMFFRWLEPLH